MSKSLWNELFHGPNPRANHISSAIDIVYEENKGRYAIAKESIPAGALLISEDPYAYCIYDECGPYFCQHCLEPLDNGKDHETLPCDHCADPLVQYCSTTCRDQAWTAYHSYECGPIRRMLHCVGLKLHSLLLALRILVKTPIKAVIDQYEYLQRHDSSQTYGSKPEDTFNSLTDHFTAIMSLLPDEDCVILNNQSLDTGLGKLCQFVIEQLKTAKSPIFADIDWPQDFDQVKKQDILSKMLLAILKRLSRNRQGILEHRRMVKEEIKTVFEQVDSHKATAIYPTAALLNHGCLPNIHMMFHEHGSMQTRAIMPIKTGESLVHCYGPKFAKEPRSQRQKLLKADYLFDCQCIACTSPECQTIETEMTMIKCEKCTADCSSDQNTCPSCKHSLVCQRSELEKSIAAFESTISTPAAAKSDENCTKILEEWKRLESMTHEHHKKMNELRGKLGALMVVSGRPSMAEPLLVGHVTTTKRHTGPLSLRTALAVSRLIAVYRESNTDKYWLSAALMIRIHLNHFGTKHVRKMFEENGLLHFLPAIDMIENGAV